MEGTAAALAARPNGGSMEGRLRNIGNTYDEINEQAAKLATLFRRLDEQEGALKDSAQNGHQPTSLIGGVPGWVDEARKLWREADSVAQSERRHLSAAAD